MGKLVVTLFAPESYRDGIVRVLRRVTPARATKTIC